MVFKPKAKKPKLPAPAGGKQVVLSPKQRATLFKPGQSGNPAGRQKGSRNKLGEAFLTDFLADWEVGGPSAIQACRLEDPARYVAICASILPKDLTLDDEERLVEKFLAQFKSVEDVRAFRRDLASLIAGQADGNARGQTKS